MVHRALSNKTYLSLGLLSPLSMISLLVDGLSHNYRLAIPFHFVLSVKYNTCLWSTVAHLVEPLTGDRRIASLRLTASGVTVFRLQ